MCWYRLLQTFFPHPSPDPIPQAGRCLFPSSFCSADWSCGHDNRIRMSCLLIKWMLFLPGVGRECGDPLLTHHHSPPPAVLRSTLRCPSEELVKKAELKKKCVSEERRGEVVSESQGDGPMAPCNLGSKPSLPPHQPLSLSSCVRSTSLTAIQPKKVGDNV